jgi:hypothetical protein
MKPAHMARSQRAESLEYERVVSVRTLGERRLARPPIRGTAGHHAPDNLATKVIELPAPEEGSPAAKPPGRQGEHAIQGSCRAPTFVDRHPAIVLSRLPRRSRGPPHA